jgi:hypothetical protein
LLHRYTRCCDASSPGRRGGDAVPLKEDRECLTVRGFLAVVTVAAGAICRLGCTDGFFRLVAACCRSCFGSYPSKRWLLELLVKIRLQILPVVLV